MFVFAAAAAGQAAAASASASRAPTHEVCDAPQTKSNITHHPSLSLSSRHIRRIRRTRPVSPSCPLRCPTATKVAQLHGRRQVPCVSKALRPASPSCPTAVRPASRHTIDSGNGRVPRAARDQRDRLGAMDSCCDGPFRMARANEDWPCQCVPQRELSGAVQPNEYMGSVGRMAAAWLKSSSSLKSLPRAGSWLDSPGAFPSRAAASLPRCCTTRSYRGQQQALAHMAGGRGIR